MLLQTSELGVTEHIEGDPCKFALWAGRTPTSDSKTILKVNVVLEVQKCILLVLSYVACSCSLCTHCWTSSCTFPVGVQYGGEARVDPEYQRSNPGADSAP